MGAITGLLGLGGGAAGTGQNIVNPTNPAQLQSAYQQAQAAQQQQAALLQALQGQNGIQNQSNVYNQLQGVANGTGPNPAQAMLNQATGANVSNQASLMAGQRGTGANSGLIARQAAQQGAGIQQQAAGQGATMQANQSLNALGQAGNIATNQVGNLMGGTAANTQAAQSEQSLLNGANAGVNSINGQLANTTLQNQGKLIGGLAGGAGAALGSLFQGGGESPMYDMGGTSVPTSGSLQMPQIGIQYAHAEGGMIEPKSSLGRYITKFANGGDVGSKLKSGGHVPGTPKVAGNSYANDTVKALLSPGEVVIPNSVMQSKDPVNNAAKFVASVMAKKRMKNG